VVWAERRTSAALSLTVAALALGVAAPSVFACTCVAEHPAAKLARAEYALVGTVESAGGAGAGAVIRVEQALKGALPERITLAAGSFTSCSVALTAGSRVAIVLTGAPETWQAGTCNMAGPEELAAASRLPALAPGSTRLIALMGNTIADSVALDARGRPVAYGGPQGAPRAVAACGKVALVAARRPDGELIVSERTLPGLMQSGYTRRGLGLSDVSALHCADDGRRLWAAGPQGANTVLVALDSPGPVRRLLTAPAGSAVTFDATHAYVALRGRVRIVTLADGSVRTVRHAGAFAQIAVDRGRVAGRLRDGRAGLLDLRSGRLRTGPRAGGLVWVGHRALLDARNGTVLDTRLGVARRLAGRLGRVVAVDGATAYLASGQLVRRLRPGARRAEAFARLSGDVVGIVPAAAQASAAWHSCEKSAKKPLTT
jgi:hypothetical protein